MAYYVLLAIAIAYIYIYRYTSKKLVFLKTMD